MSDPFIAAASLEGVPSAFRAARDGMDAILRDRGLRRSTPDDTARSLLIGAWATATLEGSECDLDELAAGGGDATARAAVRLSTELLGLLPIWQRSPVQAMARLHALAAAGSVPDSDLGRPVNPEGTARLTLLASLLSRKTEAPGLVVAALTHAEIAAAGAFVSHNGVVARAAERLVLVARGVDPASVTVPEAGHVAAAPDYFGALAAYGAEETGVHQWLLYAAEAFTRGAEASPLASR
ncbi:oxidoreductase [Aeromicrobium sp. 636]|uniref:Oxidoreductase n=1 Tax=Aeromicrobium senzhongii TaxID=2663859 RepID=A0A8I0EVV4_9ACTN|nr:MULTISPECIES: oxidoreductase [Aeromicrobium]MBC9227129.1 oxidoreductase [Aeromicrobium senzhongii]MCQ3999229.1 oxidoreductase [Aeromicrobium sp. 636]MTB88464.1 oxidoreductase [Aeromicrobium senzhongii]QNL94573.1 oxidoreductase [Aeromicrobium senzhongii]